MQTPTPPEPGSTAGDPALRPGGRRLVVFAALTVLANLLFLLLVDRSSTTERRLTLTLEGSKVVASLDYGPASVWDQAPAGEGPVSLTLRRGESPLRRPGIDNLVVSASPSGERLLAERFPPWRAPVFPLPDDWETSWRGHLVSDEGRPLTVGDVVLGDGSVAFDVIHARGVEVQLRAGVSGDGLLFRWDRATMAWYRLRDGGEEGPFGQAYLTDRLADVPEAVQADIYGSLLASYLLPSYFDGWRFVLRYVAYSLPGFALIALLGAVHLLSRRNALRLSKPGSLWPLPRWVRVAGPPALIVCVSLLGAGTAWRRLELAALPAVALFGLLLLLLALVGLLAAEAVRLARSSLERRRMLGAIATAVLVTGVAAAAGGYSAYVSAVYLEGIPHVQDSTSYLLAAKALLHGQLKIPIDPPLGPFFYLGHFFNYREGYLYPIIPGWYFAGHPLLLALGLLVGAPWIVNPMSSALTLVLLFLLARELFGTWTGVLALLLGAVSPFARFQSASMLTHPSSLLAVTAAMLFLVYWLKRDRALHAVCLGAVLGAALNIRLYDGCVLVLFVGAVLAISALRLGWRRFARGAAVAALAAAPFLVLLAWQVGVLRAEAGLEKTTQRTLEWKAENLNASYKRLAELDRDLFGWEAGAARPSKVTAGLLLFALLVLPKKREDWLICGWAFLYLAAYAIYPWHGNMFGPRYWYPSIGGQLILMARLFQILPGLARQSAAWLWPPGKTPRWSWLPWLAGAAPMAALVLPLFSWTLFSAYPGYYRGVYNDPNGYNGFDTSVQELVRAHGIHRGIVFFADLPRWQWEYAAIAANDISFNGDVIYARYIEGRAHLLAQARPEHPPYVITWNGSELELGRLVLDPQTGQGVSRPLPRGGDPLVFGETSIYEGLPLPGGLPLVGGLCAGPRGELYVMHALGREVLVFDAGGLLRRRLRASYSFGPGAIRVGRGLAVDEGGRVYVVDHKPGGLVCLEPDGTLVWRASENRETGQQLRAPIDCELLPNGDLVVADSASARLHRVSREGALVGYLGAGEGEPVLSRPYSVAAGPEGRLYVADGGRMALVELDGGGAELRQWPLPLQQQPSLENVPFVAVDADGNAYVVDTSGWVVYRTVPGQGELAQLSAATRLSKPWGIAVRGDELLVLLGDRRKVAVLRP